MTSFFSHVKSILILPFNVAIVIPGLILYFTDGARIGWPGGNVVFPFLLGVFLMLPGLILIVSTIRLFAGIGKGTLAPWDPPREIVVQGAYAYVRNPMIGGVLFVLLGETAMFGSPGLLILFLIFLTGNTLYFIFSEEPGLVKRFGEEYLEYQRNVPRWLPRLRPWEPKKQPEPLRQSSLR